MKKNFSLSIDESLLKKVKYLVIEEDIIVYDISDKRSTKKSKYSESTSRLILVAYSQTPENKFICWVNNGKVIDEQCNTLIENKEIPSSEGMETVLQKVSTDNGNDYWVFG